MSFKAASSAANYFDDFYFSKPFPIGNFNIRFNSLRFKYPRGRLPLLCLQPKCIINVLPSSAILETTFYLGMSYWLNLGRGGGWRFSLAWCGLQEILDNPVEVRLVDGEQ